MTTAATTDDDFDGWVPVRLLWREGQPRLHWLQLGKVHYAEPFFEMSIGRCRAEAMREVATRESSLDQLVAAQERNPGPRPAGFIFHMSRCGSTLVAQLLASLPRATVISEAPPIDAVLRAHLSDASLGEPRRIRWLQALLGALGAASSGEARRFFVKFDAWSALQLPLIHRAFPEVPWIFVCREPLQVMQSHARMRGSHMVPGVLEPQVFGWSELPQLPFEDYGAEVLARICEAAAAALDSCGRGTVLNYRELPEAVWTRLPAWFGIDPAPEDLSRMRDTARLDAKQPGLPFDPAAPRPAASPALLAAVEQRLRPAYERLETVAAQAWGERGSMRERIA